MNTNDEKRGWRVVIILMIAYTFSFIDRNILTFMVEPMKRDMDLSDTEMSLLLGASFGLFYSFLGIPLGRLADIYSRKKIISVGVALWSIMTAVCGVTTSYFQLFLARMGVGVGEATLSPAAYSIISDYFPKEKLATAISVYSMGIYIGSAIAAGAGGYAVSVLGNMDNIVLPFFGEIYAWQIIFIIVGLPGLLVSLLVLTIKEPKRLGEHSKDPIPLSEVWSYLRTNGKTFFFLCGGFAFFYLTVYACSSWLPTFLMRVHGMDSATVGLAAGIGFGLLPLFGVIVGGRIADSWTKKGVPNAKIKWSLWATVLFIPCCAVFPFMPTGMTAIIALIPFGFMVSTSVGAAAAAVQEIMPNRMRGIASSILILSNNLLGLTIGPTGVALMTDYVFKDEMALGWSLLIVSISSLSVAAIFFYFALRSAGNDGGDVNKIEMEGILDS